MRKIVVGILAAVLTLGFSFTALAGQWRQNPIGWWYDNGNGTYPANQWQWIDGNGDGIAECYYFDHSGYCMVYAVTPDGYQVNADGAWVVSGQVQTRNVGAKQNLQTQSGGDSITPLMLYDETPVAENSAFSSSSSYQTGKEHEEWIRTLTFSPSYLDGTANVEYYAGGKYNSFKASVAPRKDAFWNQKHYLYLEIYGDDNLLFRSDEIIYKTGIFQIDVDISNYDIINIVCIGEPSVPDPPAFILKDARFE